MIPEETSGVALYKALLISALSAIIVICTVLHADGGNNNSAENGTRQSLPDSGDMLFDASPFDSEPDLFQVQSPSLSESDADMSSAEQSGDGISEIIDKLRSCSRFTLGYEMALATASEPDLITNHLYIRQESQSLFSSNLFFKFDGRVEILPENDHRAEARDSAVVLKEHLRECYIEAGYDNVSVRAGRQIVVWGKADAAIITDVVSARDNSDFIFIKLEDSRVGQMMLSTDIYTTLGNIFLFISPEPPTDIEPDKGTRYYRELPGVENFVVIDKELSYSDVEYGARWKKSFGKTDLSFMAGRFFSNSAIYDTSGQLDENSEKEILNHRVAPFTMAGVAGSHAEANFIFKVESAFKSQFPLQGMDVSQQYQQYILAAEDLFDISLGVEYNANDRYSISFELAHRYITGDMSSLSSYDRNSTASYLTFTKDYLNQTLAFEYMLYHNIQVRDTFHKFRVTGDITDNLQVIGSLGFFNIQDRDGNLWSYKDEDRLSVEIRYYF